MELVAAICRTGSVTQAAEASGLTQPHASAMLKELENRLGTALFSRRHRHLELTAAGQALLPEMTHALAALDAVDKLAQSLGNRRREQLVVGTVSATGASLLPAVLRELQDADPQLSVVVRVGTAAEVVEMAIQQRIDLGVILGSGAHQHANFEKIGELGLTCVVRPDHAWASLPEVTVDILGQERYVGHSRHLPVGALTSQVLEEAGFEWRPAIEVVQFSAACALTDAGCGPSVLESVTGEYARRLGLLPVPLRTARTLPLSLVWPQGKGMSGGARFVKEGLARRMAAA
ncbi:hypothetical protein ASB57_00135 [Bordetella sp. N]|nr:hypothetical protein ASB57_00135 [Bordetella sp. N]